MPEEELSEESKEEEAKPEENSSGGKKKDVALWRISWIGIISCISIMLWLGITSSYGLTFFLIAMLPSVLFKAIDNSSGNYIAKTVISFNYIGILPYLFDFLKSYDVDLIAKNFLLDWKVWMYIYSCAFTGGVLVWVLPNIVILIFKFRYEVKIKNFIEKKKALKEEWGEGVNLVTGEQMEKLALKEELKRYSPPTEEESDKVLNTV